MAPNGKRESPEAPSARGPKWTTEEVDCIVLAFDASKGNPARFHAEFNDITPGRQRTLAELRLHLPRVGKARSFDVPQKFLDDCDAVIDGVVVAPAPSKTAPPTATSMPTDSQRALAAAEMLRPKQRASSGKPPIPAPVTQRPRPYADPPLPAGKRIVCDVCGCPVRFLFVDGKEGKAQWFGMVSWLVVVGGKAGGRDFAVTCKATCDERAERRRDLLGDGFLDCWMELNVALGPHGMATFVHFMTEPECDRASLEQLMHRLYFTDDRLDPPRTVFDRRFDDPRREWA